MDHPKNDLFFSLPGHIYLNMHLLDNQHALETEKSSTQPCFGKGDVGSLQGILPKN